MRGAAGLRRKSWRHRTRAGGHPEVTDSHRHGRKCPFFGPETALRGFPHHHPRTSAILPLSHLQAYQSPQLTDGETEARSWRWGEGYDDRECV